MDDRHGKVGGSIRGAKPEDRKPICRLLTSAGLPSQDVTDAGLAHFLVCELDETVVGVVGLEPCGDAALVRSLAVAQSHRCRGIAAMLLHEVQSLAYKLGVETLYALTVTAQRYLEHQGFASVERATVPASIRASTQFRGLCPDSALCLAKPLAEDGPHMKWNNSESTADRSVALFDSGLYCAESVLLAIAESEGVDSNLIPRIATGLCSGVARTCGLCGAVSGAILAIGLAMGRSSGDETIDTTYDAVRFVLRGFEAEFGSSNCQTLLGCDLGTEEGQRFHQENNLCAICRTYIRRATQLALTAIAAHRRSN